MPTSASSNVQLRTSSCPHNGSSSVSGGGSNPLWRRSHPTPAVSGSESVYGFHQHHLGHPHPHHHAAAAAGIHARIYPASYHYLSSVAAAAAAAASTPPPPPPPPLPSYVWDPPPPYSQPAATVNSSAIAAAASVTTTTPAAAGGEIASNTQTTGEEEGQPLVEHELGGDFVIVIGSWLVLQKSRAPRSSKKGGGEDIEKAV